MESLQKELGFKRKKNNNAPKIAFLQKGIQDMKDRLGEFDRKASDCNPHTKNSNDTGGSLLHLRVEMLEKELGLKGERHTMSERISLIKESFCARVGKLEGM
eukprot:12321634-Ditylum_brightwellii.AAC.1